MLLRFLIFIYDISLFFYSNPLDDQKDSVMIHQIA